VASLPKVGHIILKHRERQDQPPVGSKLANFLLIYNFMWWYFYVLQSQINKNWFYKGSTNDLDNRLQQHNEGKVESSNFIETSRS